MYSIIPLVLIFVSLTVLILIVVKKFPALASLDVDNIPKEKEAMKKQEIISNRLKRNITKWTSKIAQLFRFIFEKSRQLFRLGFNKLYQMKAKYDEDGGGGSSADKEKKIESLFARAHELIKTEDYDRGEKILIEIIGEDSKNIDAFLELAKLYHERKDYNEAKQTYLHIIKLLETQNKTDEIPEMYYDLSLIEKDDNNIARGIDSIKEALKIQPNNPRFLDLLLEMSIMIKDKTQAKDAYAKLKSVNEENQKLNNFKKQIEEL